MKCGANITHEEDMKNVHSILREISWLVQKCIHIILGPRLALTNYHRLGYLKFILTIVEARSLKCGCWQGSAPFEGFRGGSFFVPTSGGPIPWLVATSLLPLPLLYMAFFPLSTCVSTWLSYKGPNPVWHHLN